MNRTKEEWLQLRRYFLEQVQHKVEAFEESPTVEQFLVDLFAAPIEEQVVLVARALRTPVLAAEVARSSKFLQEWVIPNHPIYLVPGEDDNAWEEVYERRQQAAAAQA